MTPTNRKPNDPEIKEIRDATDRLIDEANEETLESIKITLYMNAYKKELQSNIDRIDEQIQLLDDIKHEHEEVITVNHPHQDKDTQKRGIYERFGKFRVSIIAALVIFFLCNIDPECFTLLMNLFKVFTNILKVTIRL